MKTVIADLKNYPDKIDAIFFCTRKLCIQGIKYIHQFGIKIPEDIQILCFDKIGSFEIANIPFNYIEQPIKEMGEKAVDMLIEQINGSEAVQRCVFETKEIAVGNQSSLQIVLQEDLKTLDEVVVIGYGTQKQGNLTAAISTIKSQEIQTVSATSVAQKLQGKVSGLNIRMLGITHGRSFTTRKA